MSKAYDSVEMGKVINKLNEAIQALHDAQIRLDEISLAELMGDMKDAMQRQIDSKKELVTSLTKSLNAAASTVASKKNILE